MVRNLILNDDAYYSLLSQECFMHKCSYIQSEAKRAT